MKRITALVIITAIILSLAACSGQGPAATNSYSFDDPDIIAYINGEPVSGKSKDQYIYMAKQYSQAVSDSGGDKGPSAGPYTDPSDEMMEKTFDMLYSRMAIKAYYNDADWDNEYYKTFMMDVMIDEFIQDKDGFSEYVNEVVSREAQKALDKTEITVYNDSVIDYGSIIGNVSEHFDLPYEECVEQIFKPFWSNQFIYDYLFNCFTEYKYEGQIIEWDETNTDEFVAFLSDAYIKYDEYIDKLLNESEIVSRPR